MEEWQTARAAPPSAGEAVCMHERRRDQSSQRGAQVFGAVVVIPGMGMTKRHRENRKRDCQKRQEEALSLRPRWFAPARLEGHERRNRRDCRYEESEVTGDAQCQKDAGGRQPPGEQCVECPGEKR